MFLSDECQSHISFIIVQVIHNINYQSVWVAYLDPACSMMCLCTGVSALIVTSQVTTDYIKLIYFLHQIEPTAIQWDLLWSTDLPLLTVHTWSSHCYSQVQDVLADPSDAFLQQRRKLIEMNKAGTITVPDDWKPDPSQQLGRWPSFLEEIFAGEKLAKYQNLGNISWMFKLGLGPK